MPPRLELPIAWPASENKWSAQVINLHSSFLLYYLIASVNRAKTLVQPKINMGDALARPGYVFGPNAVLKDPGAAWRHVCVPNYLKTKSLVCDARPSLSQNSLTQSLEAKAMTRQAGSFPDVVGNSLKFGKSRPSSGPLSPLGQPPIRRQTRLRWTEVSPNPASICSWSARTRSP